MKYLMGNRLLLLISLFLLTFHSTMAQDRQEVQPYVNFVNDFADVLSPEEEGMLNAQIKAIRDSTVTEIAIVLESSLNGRDEFDRSMDYARAYKVGAEGMNSGVLIYVAVQDHKLFIQTADKAQGALTDYITKLIIDQSITPEFKSGNYYQGLSNGVESIGKVLRGEFNPDQVKKKKKGGSLKSIIILFVIIVVILSLFGRGGNGGLMRGGGYFLPGMLLGGGFGGGGGGGSSGGGGFGGFGGGGGFNGGGAGGSW
jgi:uncharacterized protein